ncbi:MAG: ComEC/Rec2-related protein [Rhizobium sp.]|nr:ComEC/Rec2-related protein [Rhizobium sp.]
MTGALAEKTGISRLRSRHTGVDLDLLPGAFNRTPTDIPERPPRRAILGDLIAVAGRVRDGAATDLRQEAEFGHLFYWAPVFLGSGAACWFVLNITPAFAPLLLICVVSSIAWLFLGPWRPGARSVALAAGLLTSGALLAAFQTMRSETIILDGAVTTTVRGIVTGKEIDASGRWRYEIRLLETEKPLLRRPPLKIRVTALGRGDDLLLGDGIEGRARLSPPSGPALPGLNDFAFDAYYDGTGAFGFFYGKPGAWLVPEALRPPASLVTQTFAMLESLRGHISARIRLVLPGDTGAFAASMVTDDRRAMSKETAEALRLSGLAHIIAISGLNMALAAGLFFVGLRFALSLSQSISHHWPVKKIAAAGALVTVTLYYLISGFAVSAERAYIMMAIMLVAVFFGRPSISLRNVALSAIAILLLSPSAVMGPGFQMSYAATLALVAGYAAWLGRARFTPPTSGIPILKRLMPAWHFMAGIFMTSLIGGFSTALYSIEHFHRIAAWGLPANLLAMPVISFIVMPAGLVALILMPFGLDWLPLVVMGWGLDIVISVAKWAASLGGDWVVGRIPPWLFVGMTIGLLILAIMRSKLRYLGAGLSAGLLLAYVVSPQPSMPSLVVFEDGSLAGIVGEKGIAISEGRPSAFITEQWQRALRVKSLIKPEKIKSKEPGNRTKKHHRLTDEEIKKGRIGIRNTLADVAENRFACREKHWCVARMSQGWTIVIAINGGYTGIACDIADIVITPARLKWDTCRSGALLFTGETLRRSGSVELHARVRDNEAPTMQIVGALDGQSRAWTQHRRYDWRTGTFADLK